MTARMAGVLRHDALLYANDREFVDTLAPFVRDGLDTGEPVIAVTTPGNFSLLQDALGAEASQVTFVDAATWYRHPPQTIADYHRTLDERLADGSGCVRVIGEVRFGETVEQQRDWMRYEAALNHAFATRPAWIVCPYDLRALPAPVLRNAARTHRHVLHDGRRWPSAAYTEPRDFLRLASAPPQTSAALLAELEVKGELAPAREMVQDVAARHGMGRDASDELTVAVNEALTNALLYGRHPVRLRLYLEGSTLACEVADGGAGLTDPLAGYTPPSADRQSGMGLWLVRQLCDHVELFHADGRSVLRLTKAIH